MSHPQDPKSVEEPVIPHTLQYAHCNNWNTKSCTNMHNPYMQLTTVDYLNQFRWDDHAVKELNRLCHVCEQCQEK